MYKDYYKALGINSDANLIEIKNAYRKLAFKYHPDKNKSENASEMFINITEAYEVLRDTHKRNIYDKYYSSFEKNNIQNDENINIWEKFGNKKAEEYSKMNFEIFLKIISVELKVIKKNSLSIGVIMFIIWGLILNISTLIAFPLFGMLLFLFWGVILNKLIKRTAQEYTQDKNNLK